MWRKMFQCFRSMVFHQNRDKHVLISRQGQQRWEQRELLRSAPYEVPINENPTCPSSPLLAFQRDLSLHDPLVHSSILPLMAPFHAITRDATLVLIPPQYPGTDTILPGEAVNRWYFSHSNVLHRAGRMWPPVQWRNQTQIGWPFCRSSMLSPQVRPRFCVVCHFNAPTHWHSDLSVTPALLWQNLMYTWWTTWSTSISARFSHLSSALNQRFQISFLLVSELVSSAATVILTQFGSEHRHCLFSWEIAKIFFTSDFSNSFFPSFGHVSVFAFPFSNCSN